jgi:serine protease
MGGMSRRPLATLALATLATVMFAPLAGATSGGAPNDPLFPAQWGLTMVNAPQAWATSTGRGITIGIVDTGADLTHQDLGGKVVASTNCIGSDGNPLLCHGTGQDDNGHGTHVAGIAAAMTDNNVGVAGMAPDAKLVVAKVLDSSGSGTVADVDAGILWVVGHGAQIVNLSLGDANMLFTSGTDPNLEATIAQAWDNGKGAIPVLAAGNASVLGLGTSTYDNALDAVVVGAVGHDGALTGYSSPTGDAKWALLAPGGSDDGVQADDIVSTYWISGKTNQYGYLAGTSMATPFVSGTLALLLSAGLTPQQAVNRLLSTVDTSVSCGSASTNCKGMLDASAAVSGLPPAVGSSGTTAPTTTIVTLPSHQPVVVPPPPTTTPRVSVPSPVTFAAPAPSPIHAAPPAVMGPAKPSTATSAPRPAPSTPTTTVPIGAPGDRVLVGLASSRVHHAGSSSVAWFALLAAAFAALVAVGIVQVMRAVPDGEP